ncbi:MAG TPA: sulfur carrier protein ThiS [Bacteroidales bacterium]|nr:sulfur carrier protein ThiS [Bacteroidales bacterium]HPT02390.1 sulfur carrier protein ThiS [Bacteroidales bacterium]
MKIILNNREEILDQHSLTISELLKVKNFSFKMLVVKINGNLVRKNEYDITRVNDGDDVMVLHLISGG